jgi:hypothetical protein
MGIWEPMSSSWGGGGWCIVGVARFVELVVVAGLKKAASVRFDIALAVDIA